MCPDQIGDVFRKIMNHDRFDRVLADSDAYLIFLVGDFHVDQWIPGVLIGTQSPRTNLIQTLSALKSVD